MSPSFYKVLFLVALLIIWKLFGKRIVALLLVRSAAQGALNDVGKKAIDAQPDFVNLARNEFPQFTNPGGIDELKNPLLASGFDYVGTFNVDKMAGVKIAMLAKPDDYVTAYIYEHPKAGIWIELVTRYQDGTCQTVSTLPSTGIQPPPWVKTVRAAKAPAMDLVRQLTFVRRSGDMKKIAADNAVREFEEGYAKSIVWQKNNGLTPEEVATVVRDWAANKEIQSEIQSYNSGA